MPCSTTPVGTCADSLPHDEPWECASAVGILMHLIGNAHPEIHYDVHQ